MTTNTLIAVIAAAALGCGARTSLVTGRDGAVVMDVAARDARDAQDAPVDAPPDPPDVATCCSGGTNDTAPAALNCSGIGGAWEWVPSCGFAAVTIAMHTDARDAAVYADADGRPGALLTRVALGPRDADGWARATLAPPLEVVAGRRYWVQHGPGTCSVATSGVAPRYWTRGPPVWDGPFTGLRWMVRFTGACR